MKAFFLMAAIAASLFLASAQPTEAKSAKQVQISNDQTIEFSARRKRVVRKAPRRMKSDRMPMTTGCSFNNDGRQICGGAVASRPGPTRRASVRLPQGPMVGEEFEHSKAASKAFQKSRSDANGNHTTYLPHPPGCPGRAFCGCGASVRVFGRSVRSLWPSTAWFKFPRTSPASGMVAVRSGHVFVLESSVGGNNWLVSDYNSGGHMSRRHVRSIAGYSIVNPHGSRVAMR